MNKYQRAIYIMIGIWLVVNIATLNYNGPFYDEAIYVTSGVRTLEGYGYSDGYLVWFAGSLLWPVLAAVGYNVAGLIGTRTVAVLLSTVALWAVVKATENLFGSRPAFWTALSLAFSGPFIALSRLGVLDIPALAGIAVSFWAATELVKRDHRGWLIMSALAFTVGFFGKYPMGLMVIPLMAIIFVLRRQKAWLDIGLFGFISAALTVAFYLPGRETLSQVIPWTLGQQPTFGYTTAMLWFELFYVGVVPLILALVGWLLYKENRLLASIMVLSLFIWPAYHVLAWNPVGQQKHVVFGFLFAYPVIGMGLSRLWKSQIGKVLTVVLMLVLVIFGPIQAYLYGRWWPDVRDSAAYLVERVTPGQRLLINEAWTYNMYLYTEHRISSPWDVFDTYRLTHNQSKIELCQYDWLVDAQGSYDWPESLERQFERCPDFRPVFTADLTSVGLGPGLDILEFAVNVTISMNDGRGLLSEKLEN